MHGFKFHKATTAALGVQAHYESYVFAARPWTGVPQDAIIMWVALPRSTRHSSVYQSWRRSSCASKVSGIHRVVTGPATDPCCSTLHCAVAHRARRRKESSSVFSRPRPSRKRPRVETQGFSEHLGIKKGWFLSWFHLATSAYM